MGNVPAATCFLDIKQPPAPPACSAARKQGGEVLCHEGRQPTSLVWGRKSMWGAALVSPSSQQAAVASELMGEGRAEQPNVPPGGGRGGEFTCRRREMARGSSRALGDAVLWPPGPKRTHGRALFFCLAKVACRLLGWRPAGLRSHELN